MYLEHYGLTEPPFRITPHTDFFFAGADRGATLEALVYAVMHDEGIVKVSGEVGSGKTMLCRMLMERLPDNVETVYLADPTLDRREIVLAIADELKLTVEPERPSAVLRVLHEHLIRLFVEGKRVVVLIDEAHAMPETSLEQIRLLSNLETRRNKLLQIVLFGQPELDDALAQPSLRQLRDRVTHSFRMRPLTEDEAGKYLSFRMHAAGYRGPEVFSPHGVKMLWRAAGGLSRRLNILADKTLLAAFSEGRHSVGDREVRAAIADAELKADPGANAGRRKALLIAAVVLPSATAGFALHALLPERQPPAQTAVSPARPDTPQSSEAGALKIERSPVEIIRESVITSPSNPQKYASNSEPSPTLSISRPGLTPEQAERLDAFPVGSHRFLRERIDAARRLLSQEPDGAWTLELFTSQNIDPGRAERFLARAHDLGVLGQIYVVPTRMNNRTELKALYGLYASREEAAAGAGRLPERYRRAFRPEPLDFGSVRSSI